MKTRLLFIYLSLAFLGFACKKEKYIDTYGPKVNPAIIPYNSLNQIIKFENGSGDTLSFRCTRYDYHEFIAHSSCKDESNCTERYHYYAIYVDFEALDNSRVFNIITDTSAIHIYYTNKTNDFYNINGHAIKGDFVFYYSPPSLWSESLTLNGKIFNNCRKGINGGYYQKDSSLFYEHFTDTIGYNKNEGIVMFDSERSGEVNASERYVLVK